MTKAARLILLVLVIAVAAKSQTLPAGNSASTTWLIDSQFGTETELGFKFPDIAIGVSVEKPLGRHLEFQDGISYSPDKKFITNDGNSLKVWSTGIYFIRPRFGLTANLTRSELWTSQFTETAWYPKFGVVLRNNYFGPGRIYMDYVLPTGCQWGAGCPLQSKRLQGPEFELEARVWSHVRIGFHVGVYHILDQSNEMLPNIPRTGAWTFDEYTVLRFENLFGRDAPSY